MSDHRAVSLTRLEHGRYRAENARGATLDFGHGQTEEFTPVELLLVAIAGCSSVDVDFLTARRAEPISFSVESSGVKTRDDGGGNLLSDLTVTFDVRFPEGPDGDKARDMLPKAIKLAHDRLCTVSRTVELGTPVTSVLAGDPMDDDGLAQ